MIAPWLRRLLPAGFVLLAALPAATETPQAFEQRITAEKRARDPAAAEWFVRANVARDRGDHLTAIALYRQVRARQPGFTHATRRLAGELSETGGDVEALELCYEAVDLEPSPLNLAALAARLATPRGGRPPTENEKTRAVSICRGLTAGIQFEADVLRSCAAVGLATGTLDMMVASTATLERVAPDEMLTAYFAALSHAMRGQFIRADLDLWRARNRGLPDAAYHEVRASLHAAWPLWLTSSWWIAAGVAAWAAAMAVLVVVGIVLSRAVLKEAQRIPAADAAGASPPRAAALRRVYAAVIALAGTAYYLSLPLLIVVVLVVGGGLLYAFLAVGHIPIKILLGLLIVVAMTVVSILKSLVVLSRDEDPGLRAELKTHPRLKAVLDAVAAQIGTRPVDTVFLLPGTELAVMERGGLVARLQGRAERCLLVGVGGLEGFRLGSFRAVLAHEYGHFVNRDTSGGRFALSVRRSMSRMAQSLAGSGASMAFSPAWWFLAAFGRLFQLISQGASRLQEVMADRWAVAAYGPGAFTDGLRHIIERSVRFGVHTQLTVLDMRVTQKPVTNLYAYKPRHQAAEEEIRRVIDRALSTEPSAYDSHPSPAQRLEWAARIRGPEHAAETEQDDAWQLFDDRADIEAEMTRRVFV